ncbi:hypothetical protein DFQ28_004428 [Apophysomyces sp. BC1034]|nr:hypothetical protein DFQ30_001121 [Apophysomyces sp. BC1015]KAG0180728.1 hypothetical protein DFQ29_010233 [Apophysomyces sp. BC1021]KAG0188729.1 hypothetical protein DFQ28_004428 [Apophysomyces sp. BC1034]
MAELLPLQDDDLQAKANEESKKTVYIDPETGKQVPMKDGKPCRTCVDMKMWSKLSKKAVKADTSKSAEESRSPESKAEQDNSGKSKESISFSTGTEEPASEEEWRRNNCPADVETLGRSTWTLLHTMAAYYPEKPAPKEKESITQFFDSFAQQYPCWFCKDDFQKAVAQDPINAASRDTLSQWLCRRHNEVNAKLNKPKFDCSKVFERWLNGPPDGRCD